VTWLVPRVNSNVGGGDVLIEWLGPTSLIAWAEIAKTWEGKSSLMDVIRAER